MIVLQWSDAAVRGSYQQLLFEPVLGCLDKNDIIEKTLKMTFSHKIVYHVKWRNHRYDYGSVYHTSLYSH